MEWHAAHETPRAARTAGSSRCRRTPRRAPATTGAPDTVLAGGVVAWRDVGFEELQARSWRGNPMRPSPERPEDHQTQGPSGTYNERARTTNALEDDPQADPAPERRHAGEGMIDPEAAPVMSAGCRAHKRALGTLGHPGHDAEREKQDPCAQRTRRESHPRGKRHVDQPSDPHRPRRTDPIGQRAAGERGR